MRKILLIIALIKASSIVTLEAQALIGLEYNHAIKKELHSSDHKLKSASELKYITPPIPDGYLFFDDFSYYRGNVFPDPTNWTDSYAFINNTYADSCISIGVATLDAVDNYGNIYSTDNAVKNSDTLTSADIDISGVTGNLYLAFFIQGGGKGDAPEASDSLVLDFFESSSSTWIRIWDTTGYQSNTFHQVIIPIEVNFQGTNFKFRFSNYTSLDLADASGGDESFLANSDFWHIDYVRLKEASTASVMGLFNDVAFMEPLSSTHYNYTSLPWDHFLAAISIRKPWTVSKIRSWVPDYTENNFITMYRFYKTTSIYNNSNTEQVQIGGTSGIEDTYGLNQIISLSQIFSNGYNYYPAQEYGLFEIKSYITTLAGDQVNPYKGNDTVALIEEFKDYYAYDDGTAEVGFGFPGNGGISTRLAYQYQILRLESDPDTLTAIDIYFGKSRNYANEDVEFQLCVWKNRNNLPGELIYPVPGTSFSEYPVYSPDSIQQLNEFTRFELENDLLVYDTIYIGLVQLTTGTLNIGYDLNTSSRSKMRYNTGTEWLTPGNSLKDGSLMIRPVFDNRNYTTSINTREMNSQLDIMLFPNPATDFITLKLSDFSKNICDCKVSVFDMLGRTVSEQIPESETLDLSFLDEGLYLVKIQHIPSGKYYTQTIIKKR